MANIIYDARKLKLMEAVKELSDAVGNSQEWFNTFWSGILTHPGIYDELLYYIDHNDFLCRYSIDDYSIVDLFIWQMQNYHLLHDAAHDSTACCKEAMALYAFDAMIKMTADKDAYKNRIQSDLRLDK